MLRYFIIGGGVLAMMISVLLFAKPELLGGGKAPQGEVLLWGTLPESEMNSVVQQFNPQVKTYRVSYKYVPENEFNQRLLEALASNNSPDLIMAPYQTILYQADRILPFSIGEKAFKDTYLDGASIFYTSQGALALPVAMEPLVLFYNRALFSKHGIVNPPSYWDELQTIVPLLTLRQNGVFVESGIALGTASVSYAKDIIMAIIMQLGQTPVIKSVTSNGSAVYDVRMNTSVTDDSQVLPLATVARFFSQFGDPSLTTYTWSQNDGVAADKFVAEKLAMYIGYAGELSTLRARNPRGEFEMTELPQTRGYNTFVTGMRMYGIATLHTSRNRLVAQTVQGQFAGGGVSPSIASSIGAVPAIRMYAATPGLHQTVARTMLVARGWYDKYSVESTAYVGAMISDIINYRQGVNDAASTLVARMRDLYSRK